METKRRVQGNKIVVDISSSEGEDSGDEAWTVPDVVRFANCKSKEQQVDRLMKFERKISQDGLWGLCAETGHCENRGGESASSYVSSASLSDSPLDLSLPLTFSNSKRKLADADLGESRTEGVQNKEEESVMEVRPSVISFASRESHQLDCPSPADPKDHFLQALGPELYKMIYESKDTKTRRRRKDGAMRNTKKPVNRLRGDQLVDEHFKKSLGESIWMKIQGC